LKGVAFFSGGKDGLYAVYLAQKSGIEIPYLLLLKTTLGVSPHFENIESLKMLANSMGKELLVFDMKNGSNSLARFISSLDVSFIVGGDIFLEEHLNWVKYLAQRSRTTALEPLFGRKSEDVAKDMIQDGFEYSIIAVDNFKLERSWLGYTFRSFLDVKNFSLKNPNIDPLGEGGEFHTIVLKSPLFKNAFSISECVLKEGKRYDYLKISMKKMRCCYEKKDFQKRRRRS
jgi:diphthine-ammonia ligase